MTSKGHKTQRPPNIPKPIARNQSPNFNAALRSGTGLPQARPSDLHTCALFRHPEDQTTSVQERCIKGTTRNVKNQSWKRVQPGTNAPRYTQQQEPRRKCPHDGKRQAQRAGRNTTCTLDGAVARSHRPTSQPLTTRLHLPAPKIRASRHSRGDSSPHASNPSITARAHPRPRQPRARPTPPVPRPPPAAPRRAGWRPWRWGPRYPPHRHCRTRPWRRRRRRRSW